MLKRLVVALILIWVTTTVVFSLIHLVPGDPAELLLAQGGAAPSPQAIAALRARLGLDQPLAQQYLSFIGGALRGDLGTSLQDGSSVTREILIRLPRTLELILAAALISVVIGLPAGVVAALQPGSWIDRTLSAIAALGLAVPVFVIGTGLVWLLAQKFQLIGAGTFVTFAEAPLQHLALLAMPAMAVGVNLSATVFRMTRASVTEALSRDYIRTARSKGISDMRLLSHHVVRNALSPVVTVLALNMGGLLGGAVLVEYVFNWPGMSGLLVTAVNARDYPMVVGAILVISFCFIFLNLLVDLLYGLLDPRVRQE